MTTHPHRLLLLLLLAMLFFTGSASAQPLAPDRARGEQLVEQLHLAELMGPLAPIALSPYFGLTCLSGAAILSAQGLLPENALLTTHPVLGEPLVFGVLLALSLFTSLPRLTKVSKSLAQMIDPLETYSGIIAYLVVVFVARTGDGGNAVEAGIVGSSMAGLLYLAMVLNIIVVNTIRFFFETLILLSPIPVVDALFEVANKALVAVLMALYAFSPFLAFAVNVLILLVCLVLFRRVHRRSVYFRHVLLGLFFKSAREGSLAEGLSLFPRRAWRDLNPFQHGHLHRDGDDWTVHARGASLPLGQPLRIDPGLLTHTLHAGDASFAITRRQDPVLAQLAEELGAELGESNRSLDSLRSLFSAGNRGRLAEP